MKSSLISEPVPLASAVTHDGRAGQAASVIGSAKLQMRRRLLQRFLFLLFRLAAGINGLPPEMLSSFLKSFEQVFGP